MNKQFYPNNNIPPMMPPIIDGGSIENEESIPEIINPEKIINNTLDFIKRDYNGSRIIQDFYKKSPELIKNEIFEKIKPHIKDLSKHPFANYFITKIIEENNDEKVNIIYNSLINDIKNIYNDEYGTFVFQKLIEKLDNEKCEEICNKLEIDSKWEEFTSGQNTNHILQIFLQKGLLAEKIYNQFDKLSKEKYGIFIIKTLLKNCEDNYYISIYEKTCNKFYELIKHEYGNYIILFFLENEKGKDNDSLYEKLAGHILDFSMDKQAVYNIEKAIEKGNETQKNNIINEILNSGQKVKNEDCVIYLAKHSCGNYVIKHILMHGNEDNRIYIIKKLYSEPNIESDKYANHLIKYIIQLNIVKNGAYNNIIPENNK